MKPSIFIYALTFATLAACGHKDDAPAAAVTSAVVAPANDFQGGVTCGDRVVDAYIRVYRVCGDIRNQRGMRNPRNDRDRDHDHDRFQVDPRACRHVGNEFLRDFPQANCNASVTDRDGQPYTFAIQEAYVQRIMRN